MRRPLFVLSTGRCGSSWLRRFLDHLDNVEAFHMYRGRTARYQNDCSFILEQNYAYYNLITNPSPDNSDERYFREQLHEDRAPLIEKLAEHDKMFVDVNHEWTPFLPILKDIYPSARFIHLVRSPREVISSFMRKFDPPRWSLPAYFGTRYSLRGQIVRRQSYLRKMEHLFPDWVSHYVRKLERDTQLHPFVRQDGEWVEDSSMDAFEKTVWYWNEINSILLDESESMPDERTLRVYAKDLFEGNVRSLERIVSFAGIGDHDWREKVETVDTKVNAKQVRNDFPAPGDWTEKMEATLRDRCGETMRRLGYE